MSTIVKGSIGMAIMGLSLLLFGYALDKITTATKDVDFKQVAIIASLTLLLGVCVAIIGFPAIFNYILLGSIGMLIMGVALIPFGMSLKLLTKATRKMKLSDILSISGAMLALGGAVSLMAVMFPLVVAGAATLGAMSVALLIFSSAIKSLSEAGAPPMDLVEQSIDAMSEIGMFFSTMSLKVAGSEASMSVQPEPNELPLTVYVGANAQQIISLSRFDGENNIFLKDAITEEVVCLNDEDYTFTATPYSTISDRFTITMIEPTGIGDQAKADANIKAVVTTDGIKLFGTVEGDEVTLYTANGMVIANAIAEDGVTTIPTSSEGVIIIKVADETVKVVR
jgi:hypothetical protein